MLFSLVLHIHQMNRKQMVQLVDRCIPFNEIQYKLSYRSFGANLPTIQTRKQNIRVVAVEVFVVIYNGHHCHDMLPQRIAGRAEISRRMQAYKIGLHICG